jgi:hypothetical protein
MALNWTTVQPTEPGGYWAAYQNSEVFTFVTLRDGKWTCGKAKVQPADFDLWSWPVETPPTPVRAVIPPEE